MSVTHEPWLVALSLIVAVQGAYVGLTIAVSITAESGLRRRLRLAGASLALGVGIWAMHFIGIIAARLPQPVDYLVLPTLISFLVCVIVVSVAFLVTSTDFPAPWKIGAAAIFMGIGIVSMHYVGMMALHASLHMHHDPLYVALSVIVSIGASALALRSSFGKGRTASPALAAIALGLAISGMHYVAMAGLTVEPHEMSTMTLSPAISSDFLAIVVAMVAFFVSGVFLLTLLPEGSKGHQNPVNANIPARSQPDLMSGPAVGAKAPGHFADRLPIQRAGMTHMMPVEHIFSVQANGHYTSVFDGAEDHFCQLSISEVSERLDPDKFLRVHRSHLISLAKLGNLKKGADGIFVELTGQEHRAVPVSRGQVVMLKNILGARLGEASL